MHAMKIASRAAVAAMLAAITPLARADDLVGDVRTIMLVRDDNNYFTHATKFGYDFPNVAGGIMGTLGVALGPRVTVLGEGFYALDGADRGDARIRLASGALLGVVRASLARAQDKTVLTELAVLGGFGRYYVKETYVDPDLSPMVYSTSTGSFGGVAGLEASIAAGAFRAVIGYGYHYAPATVDDRVRGSVDAGGHEVSFGIGVRL